MSGWEKHGCEGKISEGVKQDNPKKCLIGPIKGWLFGEKENYCQEKKDFNPDPASYIQPVFFSLAAERSQSTQDECDKKKAFKDIKEREVAGWNWDKKQNQEIDS